MFASIELARRIEGSGVKLLEGAAARAGGFVERIGQGAAIFAGADAPMTKVVGIGFEPALDLDALARVEAAFAEHGAPVVIELSTLATTGVAEQLTRRGYTLVGFEDVLGRSLAAEVAPSEPPPGVRVTSSGPEELDAWVDVAVSGFSQPDGEGIDRHESFPADTLREIMRREAAHHQRFAAWVGGAIAATASMSLADGVAWFNGSATLPAHRRRGLQTALYGARLHLARAQGADVATVTVSPGSRSKHNAERQGFSLLYTRAILRGPA